MAEYGLVGWFPREQTNDKISCQYTFPAFCSGEQTQVNEVEARVDSFITITVFCPAEPQVGAFVHMNAGTVCKRNHGHFLFH